MSPSASASTFSLCGSSSNGSCSRDPSLTRDSQNSSSSLANFDDDMELGDSISSTQNHETTSTHLNSECITIESLLAISKFNFACCFFPAPADVLSASGLNEKSLCQIEAARFLAHCSLCLSSSASGDGEVMSEDGGDMTSGISETLVELLEECSRSVHIHIVSHFNKRVS